MIRLIATYLATALAFAALDYVWLSQFGPKVYRRRWIRCCGPRTTR